MHKRNSMDGIAKIMWIAASFYLIDAAWSTYKEYRNNNRGKRITHENSKKSPTHGYIGRSIGSMANDAENKKAGQHN